MMSDGYVVAIAVLLPLTATLVVTQTNPYHALVMRGILGAVVALVYALFGAADVALTEALVGTMLSITLYAIAVRSSMTLRVGMGTDEVAAIAQNPDHQAYYNQMLLAVQQALGSHHLRLERVQYPSQTALQAALQSKAIHAICTLNPTGSATPYCLHIRVPRLYQILQPHLPPEALALCELPQTASEHAVDVTQTPLTDLPHSDPYKVQP